MKKFLCLLFLAVGLLALFPSTTQAQASRKQNNQSQPALNLNQTIDIDKKTSTVTQTITGITTEKTISLPVLGLVQGEIGTTPVVNTEQKDGQLIVPTAGQEKIVIEYQSEGIWREFTKEVVQIVVAAPVSFSGNVDTKILLAGDEIMNPIGSKPTETDYEGDRQFFNYKQASDKLEPIILLKGSAVQATLKLESRLENDSFWWKNITTILPLDTSMQASFVKSIDPNTNSMRIDKDGNIQAIHRLFPKQDFSTKTQVDLDITQGFVDPESEGQISQLPSEIVADYTKNTDIWREGQLKKLGLSGEELRKGSVVNAVEKITSNIVADGEAYNPEADFSARKERAKQKPSTSIDYADQTVAALREAGIPARVVAGWKVDPMGKKSPHAWVEAFIPPDDGWLAFDPGLMKAGEVPFGVVLFDHVANIIWGANDVEPIFDNSAEWDIEYKSLKLESSKFEKDNFSSKKYMILPGISILYSKVNMPSGQVVDAMVLETSSGFRQLGSLAPLQRFHSYQLSLGGDAFDASKTTLGVGIDGEFSEVFVESKTSVVYWTMIVTFAFVVVLAWLLLALRKRANHDDIRLYPKDRNIERVEDSDLLDVKGTKITIPVKKKK
jgi:hypothetical protein